MIGQHLLFFGIILNLFAGIGIILHIYQLSQRYVYKFLRSLANYTLFFNLGLLLASFVLYFQLNLKTVWGTPSSPLLNELLFLGVTICEFGLLYSLMAIGIQFGGKEIPKRLRQTCSRGLLSYIGIYIIRLLLNSESFIFKIFQRIQHFVFDNILLLEIPLLIWIWIYAHRNPDRIIQKMGKSFSIIFLWRYLGIAVGFITILLLPVPLMIRLTLTVSIFLLINFAPFIWVRFFFMQNARKSIDITGIKKSLDLFFKKHDISKREQEIVALILEGKSNKEIEDKLFISFHTVKNHISNIYQKLGIKSRYELIHMITQFKDIPI